MEALIGLTVVIFSGLVNFLIGLGIMIYGWGLTPKSWAIIIGGTAIQMIFLSLMTLAGKLLNK